MYCWKLNFWNFNGYSDLNAVEGIVGKGRGVLAKQRYTWKECVSHGVVVGEKMNNKEDIEINRLTDGD